MIPIDPPDRIRIDRRSFVGRVVASGVAASILSSTFPGLAAGRDREKREKEKAKEAPRPTRVRVWAEGTAPRSVYPDDVDGALAEYLRRQGGLEVERSRLGDRDAGLSDEILDHSDVLIWWGRLRHADVPDSRAQAVVDRVRAGRLGLVALHASCGSKPFRELMARPCEPGDWREDGRPERVVVEDPDHEIARGVAPFTIPKTATFAEPFDVPEPDAVVFRSKFEGDITFRSGLTWTVDKGRVVYFRPGHDAYPVLYHPSVRRVIANAARWASPKQG